MICTGSSVDQDDDQPPYALADLHDTYDEQSVSLTSKILDV